MANIPIPENDDSLELNVRYQPDMVLEGMLDATVPEFKRLTLTMGDEVYDLNRQLPDYSEASDGDVLQIESGEPVWGAVDALPEIEESDEGKVLTVDQGEAVWADAPSGLPEITEGDEGKVLTVVRGTETVTFVPEQSVTLAPNPSHPNINYAILSNVVAPTGTPSEGDKATLTIGESTIELSYYEDGYYNQEEAWGIVYEGSEGGLGWIIVTSESGTVTVSATREEAGELEAEWVQQHPFDFEITFTFDESTGTISASKTYTELLELMPGPFGGLNSKVTIINGDYSYTDIVYVDKTMGNVTFIFWMSFQLGCSNGWAATPPYLNSFLSRFVIASDDSVTYDERNIQIEYTAYT